MVFGVVKVVFFILCMDGIEVVGRWVWGVCIMLFGFFVVFSVVFLGCFVVVCRDLIFVLWSIVLVWGWYCFV